MRGEDCHRRQERGERGGEEDERRGAESGEDRRGESCEDGDGERASGVEGQQDAESTGAPGSTAASPFLLKHRFTIVLAHITK